MGDALTQDISRETSFLDDAERYIKQIISIGLILIITGSILLTGLSHSSIGVIIGGVIVGVSISVAIWNASEGIRRWWGPSMLAFWIISILIHGAEHLIDIGEVVGWIAVIVGAGFELSGLPGLRALSKARESLKTSPIDARLKTELGRSYGGLPYKKAQLWPDDSGSSRVLAQFVGGQWSMPRYMTVDKVSAQVYGAPTRGEMVVVSCSEGMLFGRIGWSRYGREERPPGPFRSVVLRFLEWLFKQRSFLPRRGRGA
jgi:hypothetical protein